MTSAAPLVMIVDDDPDIREAMTDFLSLEGYRIVTASNGAEAMNRLRGERVRPCLMLLDLMMPVMSGEDVLDALEQDQELVGIPVVVVTASPRALKQQAQVLLKPIRPEVLLEVVKSHCPVATTSG